MISCLQFLWDSHKLTNFKIFKIYVDFFCQPASQPVIVIGTGAAITIATVKKLYQHTDLYPKLNMYIILEKL